MSWFLFPLHSEVIRDGSIGPAGGALAAPYDISAALGEKRGGNLFHSFSRFNIETGQSATFHGPADVQNILARVTGGASSINGKLASSITGANLFLINPAGILFGPNATLDISGSFFATTADHIRLGTDGRFDASNPAATVLSIAPPSAFGFTGATAGTIQVNGSAVRGAPGKTLGLIGGDVIVDGASLQTPGGEIHLVSGRSGELGLTTTGARTNIQPQPGATLGRVEVRNTQVGSFYDPLNDTTARRVVIRGGTLAVANSQVLARATQPGEGIHVQASGAATLESNALLYATVSGDLRGADAVVLAAGEASLTTGAVLLAEAIDGGAGGNVHLAVSGRLVADTANVVTISSPAVPGGDVLIEAGQAEFVNAASANTNPAFGEKGGDVRLSVAGQLSLASGSTLGIPASGGERVEISAGEILIHEVGSGIFAKNLGFGSGSGSVHLAVAGRLAITGGGVIAADAADTGGTGARIAIEAGEALLSGVGSGISAQIQNTVAGSGGDIRLSISGRLDVLDGATINSNTSGPGGGGSIDIIAGDVHIAGGGAGTFGTSTNPRGITAQNLSFGSGAASGPSGNLRLRVNGTLELTDGGELLASTKGTGRGGRIGIVADELRIRSGSQISAATSGSGRGGDIDVRADEVFLSGTGSRLTTISSENASGSGGSIGISANQVRLTAAGEITASTFGSGTGGNVGIRSATISVRGAGSGITSSSGPHATGSGGDIRVQAHTLALSKNGTVTASAAGAGNGGSVRIAVDRLVMESGSAVSVAAAQSNAGNISIAAKERIELDRSRITAQAALNGGNIRLTARDLLFLTDSEITTAAGLNGGNIFIDPRFVVLDHSLISANAVLARGGNVRIISDFFLAPPGSLVTAASERGVDGIVRIDALDTDVAKEFGDLPSALVDAESLLRELCTVKIESFSSFIVEGRGGLPPLPGETLPSLQIVR